MIIQSPLPDFAYQISTGTMMTRSLCGNISCWPTCVCVCVFTGVKERHTMVSPPRGSGALRRKIVPIALQSSQWQPCPERDAPPLLLPSYQMRPAWSTLPTSPVWKTTANPVAPPAWRHAVPGRVSVSAHIVCVFVCAVVCFVYNSANLSLYFCLHVKIRF